MTGNPTNRKDIELLPLEVYDSILILADEDYEENKVHDMMQADTRSLTALLLIRDIQQKRNVNTRVKGRLTIFDDDFTSRRHEMDGQGRALSPPLPERQSDHRDSESDDSDEDGTGSPRSRRAPAAVISEILDVRTKPLISVASVTDYVTSNELVGPAVCWGELVE